MKRVSLLNYVQAEKKSELNIKHFYYYLSFEYSNMSPGWHSRTSQIASKVVNLIAFALPVFKMERFDRVRPTLSESAFNDIFLLAIITSKFTIIDII